jgi:hypothetical protein
MGKKSSNNNALLIGIAVVVALIAIIPKEIWILIAITIAAYFIVKVVFPKFGFFVNSTENSPAQTSTASTFTQKSSTNFQSRNGEPVLVIEPQRSSTGIFRIREPAPSAHWVVPGETIQVGSITLT